MIKPETGKGRDASLPKKLMDQPPPVLESQSVALKPHTMSLAARLLNVFAIPGDVFEEVKATAASAGNWLAPVVLSALVGAISAIIIFSQPAIQQQMREQQAKAMDRQVKSGHMTQEQADQALAITEKFMGPTMLKIFGAVGAVVVSFLRVLWWAFVLWLLGRWFLKTRFGYGKTLEITGLAMMISVLGTLVTLLLTVNLARLFATPSLALVVSDFDATRKSHLMLGAINVFSLWQVGLMALGLARLAGVPFFRAAWVVFAYWVAQELFFILIGLGQFAL
jgi:Yip1-like protein